MKKDRVLSGMQPTGKLHLGNYVGALENWVKLQDEGYQNFHMVADWHTLTVDYEDTRQIHPNTLDVVIDWLCAGIDPEKSVVFVQSRVKEHAELHLLFSMLITVPRLQRNPTLKERIKDLHLGKNISYGHLGYPVLQAADILIYKADYVPVGEDQMPHIELTREIARRFNYLYGNLFPEPEGLVTPFSRMPGLDGRKMSKSLGNTILLSDPPEVLTQKVMSAFTDPEKIRLGDPGHPEICVVFAYHRNFNQPEIPEIERDCRNGKLGCVACKKNLIQKLIAFLEPWGEKRRYYEDRMDEIEGIIEAGIEEARQVARATMDEVRETMKIG
ncbi:tryptophan--tRNA ligase [candidate division KSB1 bacterium]|nr:tryptophan--tRNA ligase [candidate division KSB1 bacterium]